MGKGAECYKFEFTCSTVLGTVIVSFFFLIRDVGVTSKISYIVSVNFNVSLTRCLAVVVVRLWAPLSTSVKV